MGAVNAIRGEAEIVIAGATYRLEANMDGLARLAEALGDPPLQDLYRRLIGSSLFATRVSLAHFIQGGTDASGKQMKQRDAVQAAIRDFTLSDVDVVQTGMVALLAALVRKDEAGGDDGGNAQTASA